MRDFLTYVRLTTRVMVRDDAWLIILPLILLVVMGAWTLYFTEIANWQPAIPLAQAEVFGPFLAAFLFAGLLDPEHRRGAGEIVFSKPHPPVVLLGVRMLLALLATLGLLLALLLCYRSHFGKTPVLQALVYAAPPVLFIGSVAVTAAHFSRSAATGYAVPLAFWLWDTTGGVVYNPLFFLPVGSMAASTPAGAPLPFSIAAAKSAMLLTAAFLFWINVRRLRRGGA
jgi:hypothetical protein